MITALLILALQASAPATAPAQTPSLADVARQERARQKTVASGVTFTNASVGPPSEPAEEPPPANKAGAKPEKTSDASATAPAAAPAHDEAWWRNAFKAARDDVQRAEDHAKVLQLELNDLNRDLLNRSDIYNREGVLGPQINAKNAELAAAEKEAEQARAKVDQLQNDLRLAGGPPGLGAVVLYLGIDGGGSKTAFLLEDEDGAVHERFETGPSNWLSAGKDEAQKNIAAGIAQLTILPDIVGGGFAGAGRAEGIRFYRGCLGALLPSAKIFVDTDATISYAGAIGLEPGVLLIAGTGSIAIGRRRDGTMIRAGGWGPIFSDDGSGFWIGREAIRHALRASDAAGVGNMPEFTASICHALHLESIDGVSTAWNTGALTVRTVAALAELVLRQYPAEPANQILIEAARQLRAITETVLTQIGIPDCRRSVVGSIGNDPVMRKLIAMEFDDPRQPPERGAILWARSQLLQ